MLEVITLISIIIVSFVSVGWYALYRSKQNRNEVLDEMSKRISIEAGEAFNAVFEDEMAQQINDSQAPDIDSEPVIVLSEQAQKIKIAPIEVTARKSSIDITIDDDIVEDFVEPQKNKKSTIIDWDMVVAFTIIAAEEQKFSGLDLKVAFENLNFKFGEMDIYHHMLGSSYKTPLFSVANIREPGTFDPQDIPAMATSGILLFAKLPGPINGLALFDELLETAQSFTNMLSGTLCDEERKPVNQKTFERMRSRILELNLSIQSEQRQYGSNDYSN